MDDNQNTEAEASNVEGSNVENATAPTNPDLLIPHASSHSHLLLIISAVLAATALILMAGFLVLNWYIRNEEIKPSGIVVIPTTTMSATKSIPTPNPTQNWKTYNNTQLNYSIKYPSSWYIFPNVVGGIVPGYNGTVINSAKQLEPHGERLAEDNQTGISITVDGIDKKESESLKDWLNRSKEGGSAFSETTLISLPALVYHNTAANLTTYLISNSNIVLQINIQDNGKNSSTIEKILSTLKFTNEPTSNLKTFTGTGFSFQYDTDWDIDTKSNFTWEGQKPQIVLTKQIRPIQPTGPFEQLPSNSYLSVYKIPNINNATANTWTQIYKQNNPGMEQFNPVQKTITVDGQTGIEIVLPSMNGSYLSIFFDKDNKNIYIINFEGPISGENSVVNDLKNQILSTFKFTI